MSEPLLRGALGLRCPIRRLPSPFFGLSTTAAAAAAAATATSPPPSLLASRDQQTPASVLTNTPPPSSPVAATMPFEPVQFGKPRHISRAPLAGVAMQSNVPRSPPTQPPSPPRGPLPDTVRQLLPLLRTQPSHYITIHIHGRPYLVTPGDSIRLPFLMPGVGPGDVLRFNRASVLGSRDLTLRPTQPVKRTGPAKEVAYIDERVYECRATVMGVDSEPMRSKEKTKRRNRKTKTIKSKHRYTVVRISELKINSPEEVVE